MTTCKGGGKEMRTNDRGILFIESSFPLQLPSKHVYHASLLQGFCIELRCSSSKADLISQFLFPPTLIYSYIHSFFQQVMSNCYMTSSVLNAGNRFVDETHNKIFTSDNLGKWKILGMHMHTHLSGSWGRGIRGGASL